MPSLETFTYQGRNQVPPQAALTAHWPTLPRAISFSKTLCMLPLCLCNRCRHWNLLEDSDEREFRGWWHAMHPDPGPRTGLLSDDALVIWLGLWAVANHQTQALESLALLEINRVHPAPEFGDTRPLYYYLRKTLMKYVFEIAKETT